jgi:hypothetical protein
MAEMKTKATRTSVATFLKSVPADRREDCQALVAMMQKATGAPPVMWGPSIVGFGSRRLVYDSGRELDWFHVGFSPRKAELTLYGVGLDEAALEKLGRHKTGKGCLYIRRLAEVDTKVLRGMIAASVKGQKSRKA